MSDSASVVVIDLTEDGARLHLVIPTAVLGHERLACQRCSSNSTPSSSRAPSMMSLVR
jgi:hypothetical protein